MCISNRHKELKERAIKSRLEGKSYRQISDELGVARSTLNGWLKTIPITDSQKQRLHERWLAGLKRARSKAGSRNVQLKEDRIKTSQIEASTLFKSIKMNKSNLEIFMAGLYLGEGFKIENRLGLGNANPKIALAFLTLLRKLYDIDEKRLRAAVYCRADQDSSLLVKFWSHLLEIPQSQFHKTQFDKRTRGTPTNPNYHGVCAVSYNDSSIQRRILAFSEEMIKYINKPNKGL